MAQPAGQDPLVNPAPARPGRQQQGGFGQSISGIIRMAVMWYFAMKFFSPKKPSEPSVPISNLFQKGEPLAVKHKQGASMPMFFFARSGYPQIPNDPMSINSAVSAFGRTH
ncbi:hypothetical protein J5N97_001315 [Dioscorea zingiberensis]|uniref:Uncharacterized protein n=1 Tax=Dioscorea zingiberensis TaxID=325984 RepID=A0A9D5H2J4_9LILI|nr:hypothetical protein J5N97_001315 [Dioscorea zingiberensis]